MKKTILGATLASLISGCAAEPVKYATVPEGMYIKDYSHEKRREERETILAKVAQYPQLPSDFHEHTQFFKSQTRNSTNGIPTDQLYESCIGDDITMEMWNSYRGGTILMYFNGLDREQLDKRPNPVESLEDNSLFAITILPAGETVHNAYVLIDSDLQGSGKNRFETTLQSNESVDNPYCNPK